MADCRGRPSCGKVILVMKADAVGLKEDHGATEALTLKVAILYDEADSGRRAKRLFDRVAQGSSGRLRFSFHLCRFSWLEASEEAKSFGAQARDAELLALSLRERQTVPQHTANWLDTWAQSRATPAPALLLLSVQPAEDIPGPSPGFQAVRSLAQRHGLECLEPGGLHTGLALGGLAAELREREHAITPTLAGIMDRPCRLGSGNRCLQPVAGPTPAAS